MFRTLQAAKSTSKQSSVLSLLQRASPLSIAQETRAFSVVPHNPSSSSKNFHFDDAPNFLKQGGRHFSAAAAPPPPPPGGAAAAARRSAGGFELHQESYSDHPLMEGGMATYSGIARHELNDETLRSLLSESTWNQFVASRHDPSAELSKAVKNELANALMKWALSKGAGQFAHWYHPNRTRDARAAPAMKFDTFISLDFGSKNPLKPVKGPEFSGAQLFHNETDGSSFPNGGMRATNTAAAYVTWDKTSAPFVRGDTLYLPAAFCTYYGQALDHKLPLLRAEQALAREGLRLLRHLGDNESQLVVSNVGCEQEYFLMDAEVFQSRPDLVQTGRALFGAVSPKNQEGCENYFGMPSRRGKAFFTELRDELIALGVSITVNHNEVAPSQLELSPIFALSNVASDKNVLMMEVMETIAARHGLKVLFHEKPFANINGSGKHNNWGLNTDSGKNLFAPGKTKESQTDFTAFTAALMCAVHRHGDLIRAGVAVPGNDHRLGAQEAPPAIISLYTGPTLQKHLDAVAGGGALHGIDVGSKTLDLGSPAVEKLGAALDDRNRTAPFPFCGNRFEFRAVGSSQNISTPLAFLNTAVADGLAALNDAIEAGTPVRDAVAAFIDKHAPVVFNGDGYSQEWQEEAAQRGLPNNKNCVEAWRDFDCAKNVELFERMGVMTAAEVAARKQIALAEYTAAITTEAQVSLNLCNASVLPALARDLRNYTGVAEVLAGARPTVYKAVADAAAALATALQGLDHGADDLSQADYCAYTLKPVMDALREQVDQAEGLCEDWPLSKYDEMTLSLQNE